MSRRAKAACAAVMLEACRTCPYTHARQLGPSSKPSRSTHLRFLLSQRKVACRHGRAAATHGWAPPRMMARVARHGAVRTCSAAAAFKAAADTGAMACMLCSQPTWRHTLVSAHLHHTLHYFLQQWKVHGPGFMASTDEHACVNACEASLRPAGEPSPLAWLPPAASKPQTNSLLVPVHGTCICGHQRRPPCCIHGQLLSWHL